LIVPKKKEIGQAQEVPMVSFGYLHVTKGENLVEKLLKPSSSSP
jgi:hypothetical protein